jgi:hypothetical protein
LGYGEKKQLESVERREWNFAGHDKRDQTRYYRIVTEPSDAMNANHSRHGAPALAIASDVTAVADGSSRTLDELHDEHVI